MEDPEDNEFESPAEKLTKSGRPCYQVFYIGDPDVICLA
jgi:hypothetical protein